MPSSSPTRESTRYYQSAYRARHSTETILVHLYNDMEATIDRGDIGALVPLDMSAASDTKDHGIMLDVLQQRFDVHDAALNWFASYFVNRTQVPVPRVDVVDVGLSNHHMVRWLVPMTREGPVCVDVFSTVEKA